MSFFVRNISFWQQNLMFRARQADNYGNRGDNALIASTSTLTALGNTILNQSEQAGLIAARAGVASVAKAAQAKLEKLTKNAGDLPGQVTFTGSLSGVVDFGADGPSAVG